MLNTTSAAHTIFQPPAWVDDLLQKHSSSRMALFAETIRDGEELSDRALQDKVRTTYKRILDRVAAAHHYPIRFWNNVPRLTAAASEQRNRYMVFNAGRYEALADFHGDPSQFDTRIAAATTVGVENANVKIYCLSAEAAAAPLNNPRQVAPYHYSKRFGPLPPCFARAVQLAWPANWLVVGGTAAIRGEDSVYREDLGRQINETFANLAALIAAARGDKCATEKNAAEHLAAYRELRVYFPNPEHESVIRRAIGSAFANVQRLELLAADLCRPELLVEIEGVAELPA